MKLLLYRIQIYVLDSKFLKLSQFVGNKATTYLEKKEASMIFREKVHK